MWQVEKAKGLLLLLLALDLSAGIFLVRADDEPDPCPAVQERLIDLYNSPGCSFARSVVAAGDVMTGEVPPDPIVCSDGIDDGMTCVANVTQVAEDAVEYGCATPEPAEELLPFLWLTNDNYEEFMKSTSFYCSGCYSTVRDGLEADCGDYLDPPEGSTFSSYVECFRNIPCRCVGSFANAFEDSSPAFVEDFGPPSAVADAAREASAMNVCGEDVGTEPTTSGGRIVGLSRGASVFLAVFIAFTWK